MIPIKQFVLGGKAVFTLTDNTSSKHYTYRVNRAEKRDPREPSKFFVNLGTGYDDSVYMGMIVARREAEGPDSYVFIQTKASRVGTNAPSWRVFQLMWDTLTEPAYDHSWDDVMTNGKSTLTFRHEGKCCVCARPLTNPISIDEGIGPECAGRG